MAAKVKYLTYSLDVTKSEMYIYNECAGVLLISTDPKQLMQIGIECYFWGVCASLKQPG